MLLALLGLLGATLYWTGSRLLVDAERSRRQREVELSAADLAERIEQAERAVRALAESDALERLTRATRGEQDEVADYKSLDGLLTLLSRDEALLRLEVVSLGFQPPLCGFERWGEAPALELLAPASRAPRLQARASAAGPRQLLLDVVGEPGAARVAAAWRTGRGWLIYAEVDARAALSRCAAAAAGGDSALLSGDEARWPREGAAPFAPWAQPGARAVGGEIHAQALVRRGTPPWQLLVRAPQLEGFSLETKLTIGAAGVMALVVLALGAYALRVGGLQTSLDQSERQEAELQGTFDAITDPLLVLDRGLRVVRFNRAASEESGAAERGDEYAQVLVRRGLHDPDAFLTETRRVMSAGIPRQSELVLAGAGGERVWIVAHYPIFGPDLSVSGLVEHARDVTQTRRLQSQLVQSEKLSTLGEMAAGIAHEVNNPIGVISMFAQLLREELSAQEGTQDALEKVELIEQQAVNVGDIVKGLLRFARKSEGVKVRFDARTALGRALALVAHQKLLSQVEVVREPDPEFGEPAPIVGDEGQLAQVVLNLIVNACHAMGGSGRLVLGVSRGRIESPPPRRRLRRARRDARSGAAARQRRRGWDRAGGLGADLRAFLYDQAHGGGDRPRALGRVRDRARPRRLSVGRDGAWGRDQLRDRSSGGGAAPGCGAGDRW